MDKMIYHVSHYPRQLSTLPKLSYIGYLIKKSERLNQHFLTCNISFIFRGSGWYQVSDQKRVRVEAPAILLQWPGENFEYGPDTTWDEYFIMYKGDQLPLLKKSGLFNTQHPVREFRRVPKCKELMDEIIRLINTDRTIFPADRIDLLSWQVLTESFISSREVNPSQNEEKILQIADQIKDDPLVSYNFHDIASSLGMAYSTFRRYWLQFIGVSPVRYINDLKVSRACRELVETDKTIGEIANSINIEDQLYFSRFFKKKTGFTPSEYRSYLTRLKKSSR